MFKTFLLAVECLLIGVRRLCPFALGGFKCIPSGFICFLAARPLKAHRRQNAIPLGVGMTHCGLISCFLLPFLSFMLVYNRVPLGVCDLNRDFIGFLPRSVLTIYRVESRIPLGVSAPHGRLMLRL